MHIGILRCGVLPDTASQKYGDMPDIITAAFHTIDPSIRFSVFDAIAEPLPSLDSCDAFLCTGSTSSSYDNTPWINNLQTMIRKCANSGKKVLGICFGHQVILQALGGKVEPCERGWALGTAFNELHHQKQGMQPPLQKMDILAMHRDQVSQLPEGAELLANSQFCPYFMVQFCSNILTIQGHPEFTPDIMRNLMAVNIDNFPDHKIREATISIESQLDSYTVLQWMINFINQRPAQTGGK